MNKNFIKIEKAVRLVSEKITVSEKRGCIVLTGEADDWQTVVRAGEAAVGGGYLGVINDIRLKGYIPKQITYKINDSAYEGVKPDVLIIGGGVIGCAIARELSRYKLDVMLAERGYDVALGASSRNDGNIHPGIDLHKGSQKQIFNSRGNRMYTQLSKELGIDFMRYGQTMIFSKKWERLLTPILCFVAKRNGLYDYKYIGKDKLKELEPEGPDWGVGAFFMGSAGVLSPYKLTVALAESAAQNGVKICLNTAVTGMEVKDSRVVSVATNRGTVYPKVVINAAGVYADVIADMADDRTFTIHPRKGTNLILDKKARRYVNTAYSKSPLAGAMSEHTAGHTKGGGVVRTIDGNVLVGPNAIETPDREDVTTDLKTVLDIINKHKESAQKLSAGDIITYFAGIRAPTYEEDFVIRKGIFTKNIVEAAGIQSPGLTAAPAIAESVALMTAELLGGAEKNPAFNPVRKTVPHLAAMEPKERDELIKKNPEYGVIVCRCEEVSRGEIIDALNSPVPVYSLDAIKRRVRPGMGRCQGAFCGPQVVRIISEKLGIPEEKVVKASGGSYILTGSTKEAADEKI